MSTALGDDWEIPALIEDEAWGVPLEVMGEVSDVLGMFDMNVVQKQMNTLKNITVGMANSLVAGAMDVINQAIVKANADSLPGATDRTNVQGHLQWHQSTLAPLQANPNAIYASGADLIKWATEAFVESNAVEEGADWIDAAWSKMWAEIQAKIVALPAQVRKAVGSAISNTVETVTGVPLWGWGLIAVGSVGLLGFVIYKFANTRAAGAIAGGITRAYTR